MSAIVTAAIAALGVPRLSRAPSARPTPRQIEAAEREWRRVASQIARPSVELDADTFGEILRVYARMKELGLKVDAMAEALIKACSLQVVDARLMP